MKPPSSKPPRHKTGFSLVELAIVLVIVALLASGLLVGIAAQRNAAETIDAQRQLENVRETLTGFALTHGRLPCPALPNLASSDANAGVENCAQPHGVLPWVTLGVPEVDPWGRRFTYYAHGSFTAAVPGGALASFTLDTVGNANVKASSGSSRQPRGRRVAAERQPAPRGCRRRGRKCRCRPDFHLADAGRQFRRSGHLAAAVTD